MGPPFRPETPRFLQNEFQKLPCSGLPSRSRTESPPLDVRTDHAPLARPVLAYGLAAMDVATIHTVGPGDVIGEHGQHAVYIPRVKAIVDALKEFDITIHWFSPWHSARAASEVVFRYISARSCVENQQPAEAVISPTRASGLSRSLRNRPYRTEPIP